MINLHRCIPILITILTHLSTKGICQVYKPIVPFEQTITFRMLQMDTIEVGDNETEMRLVKDLMNTACRRILKYNLIDKALTNSDAAVSILQAIDSTFTEYDFVFDTKENDRRFDIVTLALRNTYPYPPLLIKNDYQRKYWNDHPKKRHRKIDCDEYCRIYMGIAQMIGLPLSMVHIPHHYYLRWHLLSGKYFSWNANDGKAYWDEPEMECYNFLRDRLPFLRINYFKRDLDFNEVVSNYLRLRADRYFIYNDEPNIEKAKQDYDECLRITKQIEPGLLNNYVWLYIMNPELDSTLNFEKLHSYIDSAIAMDSDLNYHDAKACLFALQGRFDEAQKEETFGLAIQSDQNEKRKKAEDHLECFKRGYVCRSLK